MRQLSTVIRNVLIATVAALAIVIVLVLTITRTEFGVERFRRFASGWLADQVNGTVRIGNVRSRGLLGGMTLYDFSIVDRSNRPFIAFDSAVAAYNWRSFLAGRIVLGSLDLYNPHLVMEQLPGDSIWNFEHIFTDTTAGAAGVRRLIEVRRVRVFNGTALVRLPFEVEGPIQPADTARLLLEAAPGGIQRVFRFTNVNATLPRVVWQTPEESGKLFQVAAISGNGFTYREPFTLRNARGTVALRDSITSLDVPLLQLPHSTGSLVGRIVSREGENVYDIKIDTRSFAFEDVKWIYPRLPGDGGGSGTMRIQTLPRGTLWLFRDMQLRAPGTNLAGTFGVVTGDTTYFTDVNLRASPLNMRLVEQMLPGTLPVKGLLVGTVIVEGPLSALTTKGDVQLAQTPGATPSRVKWEGTVDLRKPYATRNFTADLQAVDLALVQAFDKRLQLPGRVTGRVQANGSFGGALKFAARLQHDQPGRSTSALEGSGEITHRGRSTSIDVRAQAKPFALDMLAAAFPALGKLTGNATGPVTITGPLDDLHVGADLQTPMGHLQAEGRFDVQSTRAAYAADGRISAFHLEQVLTGVPSTELDARFSVRGSGRTLPAARGRATLEIESGRIDDLPIRAGQLALALEDGVAMVDSARLGFDAGVITASGSFGVADSATGTLRVSIAGDSLGALRPLFAHGAGGHSAMLSARAPLDGSARIDATLEGNVSLFDVSGNAVVRRLSYRAALADGVNVRFTGTGIGSTAAAWSVDARADSVGTESHSFPNVRFGVGVRKLQDWFELAVRELSFGRTRQPWKLERPALVRMSPNGVEVDTLTLLASNGSVRAHGIVGWHTNAEGDVFHDEHPLDFSLRLDRVPLDEFLELSSPGVSGNGILTGELTARGHASDPLFDTRFFVDSLSFGDLHLQHVEGTANYSARTLTLDAGATENGRRVINANGKLALSLALEPTGPRRNDGPIDVRVAADSLPAALVTALVPGFSDVVGYISGSISATGPGTQPTLAGTFRLSDASGTWNVTGVRYDDARGAFELLPGNLLKVDASARTSSGGRSTLLGSLTFEELTNPSFALAAHADGFLASRRRDVVMTTSGDIRLDGKYRSPIVSGEIHVDKGTLFLDEIWRQYNIVTLDSPLLFDVVDTSIVAVKKILPTATSSDFLRNLVVTNFTLDVGRDAWLRSKEMNVEVSGALNVAYDRHADDLRMTGTLDAVRGVYQLYQRRFEVRQGSVEFIGTEGIDPNLNITAVYRVTTAQGDPLNIQAIVTGTLQSPRVALTSDAQPAISESDLVSYLLFGRPTYQLTATERAATGVGRTNAALAGTFDLASRIAAPSLLGIAASGLESVAQNFGIDYVAVTSAEVARSSTNVFSSFLAGSQVELGRYLTDNVFLAFTQRLATQTGGARSPGVRLEWRVLPTYTVELFARDRISPFLGFEQSAEERKVYGFFMFREWSY